MSWREEQLQFMRYDVGLSLSEIHYRTGIPKSTLSYVTRGLRTTPKAYDTSIRKAYKSESYYYLKDQGFPAHQANRFRGYGTDTIRELANDMNTMIESLGKGAAEELFKRSGFLYTFRYDQTIKEMTEKVRQGIEESELPWEEMKKDYPWR